MWLADGYGGGFKVGLSGAESMIADHGLIDLCRFGWCG